MNGGQISANKLLTMARTNALVLVITCLCIATASGARTAAGALAQAADATAPAAKAYASTAGVAPIEQGADPNIARVVVDAFVMAKCPDAVFCESFLAPVLKELQAIVTLQVHFIGLKDRDGNWHCKHGDEECAGDTQQLCVQQATKPYNRVKWLLSFMLCNNKRGLDATGTFATASKCLEEAHIPLSAATKMLGCMYGPTHQALLESDFDQTAARGIKTSCTIQFDGTTVAVRDNNKWASAPGDAHIDDFKEALCSAYAAKNRGRLPPQCRDLPTLSANNNIAAA